MPAKPILEIRKTRARKENQSSRNGSLEKYEEKQDEIKKILKQIAVGLEAHDRDASGSGGHHWGHVGDLSLIAGQLREINDRLRHAGEQAG